MIRSFIHLYLLLWLTSAVIIAGALYLPPYIEQSRIEYYNDLHSKGTFYLLLDKLSKMPQTQWQQAIRKLKRHFGYPVVIRPLSDHTIDDKTRQALRDGKLQTVMFGGADVWVRLIPGSEYVLAIVTSQTSMERNRRLSKGTLHLLGERLQQHNRQEWPGTLAGLQQHFGYPLKISDIGELGLERRLVRLLQKGQAVGAQVSGRGMLFMQRIGTGNDVLVAGPIERRVRISQRAIYVTIVFAAAIAVTVYLWMRPIWRDLFRLNKVAVQFGDGVFDARAEVRGDSAVRTLASSFNSMADSIRNLIDSNKELSNAVSHELRTPISRLRFAMEMLEKSTDEKERKRFISSMNDDIDEMDVLIAEMLTYARFEQERPELALTSIMINPWLKSLLEELQQGHKEIHISFTPEASNAQQVVVADKGMLRRVVSNIVGNAFRYARTKIDVSVSAGPQNLCIRISDDGPGIPEKDRQRVLEPFMRLDESRNRRSGGFGLGLSIVSKIIKWHKGLLIISESKYGGAQFEIFLPLTRDDRG